MRDGNLGEVKMKIKCNRNNSCYLYLFAHKKRNKDN